VSAIQSQFMCNQSSPYRCEVPDCLPPHPGPDERSRTPLVVFPAQRSRSPNPLGQPFHPLAYDYPPYHSAKFHSQVSMLLKNFFSVSIDFPGK
jgi:hypothetical protein